MLIYVTVRNDSTAALTFGNSNISLTLDDTTGLDFEVGLFSQPDDTLPFYARGRWDAETNPARYLPMTNGITALGSLFRINLSINQSTFPGNNPSDAEYIVPGATDTIAVLYMLIDNCTASNKNITFSTFFVGVVRDYFQQYSESTISRVADASASNIVLRPSIPNAVIGDTVVCEGDTVKYSTLYVDGLSYNWTTPAGTSITSAGGSAGFLALDSNNIDVAFPFGSTDGFVKVVKTIIGNGCVLDGDSLFVDYSNSPVFTASVATICGDDTAAFVTDSNATFTVGSATYTNNVGLNGLKVVFGNLSGISRLDSVIATTAAGCSDTAFVTVYPAPIIVPAIDTVCSGDSVVFSESTGLSDLTYSNVDAFASVVGSTAIFTNATAAPVLSQITVETMFGCNDTADVTVNPLPVVTAIAEDDTVCSGLGVTYQVQPFFTGGVYAVTGANSITGSTVTFAVSNTTVRFDTVSYTASAAQGGCVGETEVLVMPIPSILKGAGLTTGDTTACDTAVIDFTLQGGFVSYTGLALDWYAIDNGNNILNSVSNVANFGPVGFGTTGGTVVDTVYATYFFNTVGTDESCYDSVLVTINDSYKVDFTAFLQGAYDATANEMRNDLFTSGLLTTEFLTATPAPRTPAPAIPGITTTYIPASAVDVVEVSLRNAATGPVVATEYAWLMQDGSIENYKYAGEGVRFCSAITAGDYFIVVSHRNHLDVQSATSVAVSTTMPATPYDFTQIANVYGGGAVGLDVAPTRFGLVAGNARRTTVQDDSETNANDFYDVAFDNVLMPTGYIQTDVNMNGVVNSADFDLSSTNNDFLYFTTVP